MEARFAALEGAYLQVADRLNSIDRRLDAMDGHIDGLSARIDGLNLRIDGFSARIENLGARIDAVGAQLSAFMTATVGDFAAMRRDFDRRFFWLVGLSVTTILTVLLRH